MSDKVIQPINVQPAPRGSKRGWPPVSGQVRPEVHEQLLVLVGFKHRSRTDLVAEAVEQYVEREYPNVPADRRAGDRRAA